MKINKLLQLILVITFLGCAAPTFKQGVDAYDKGDYRTALRAFEPLAKQNNPIAQNYLGTMYYNGTNVTDKDYVLSAQWFRKAADNGSAEAALSNINRFSYFFEPPHSDSLP